MPIAHKLPDSMRHLCLAFQILVIILALFAAWSFFEYNVVDQSLDQYLARLSEDARAGVTYSPLKKNLLVALATVSFFAPVLILCGAFNVFAAFRKTDPFDPKSAKSIRFLGLTIVIFAISRIVNYTLSVFLMTYDNPTGTKELAIAINNHDLVTLMIGVILIIVGHILTRAALIAQENRQFV